MSKVYVVYVFYNNCESYEDNFTETRTLKVFDSKEKALTFIKEYVPDKFITEEEAKELAAKEWPAHEAMEFCCNADEYMWDNYNFIKGIEYPENSTDGSKWIYAHMGIFNEDPEFHIYFKEWEVE
ncbi:MAG: hypothetical protein ILA11_11045 [Butyrivibrio sp.]|nr:hypothetical protein [Butyrivibrio sp.]